MMIAIGSDHRGYALKELLKQHAVIGSHAVTWHDCGAHNSDRSDYPEYAACVCKLLVNGNTQAGILLCGTGVGMAVAANRYKGIYAGVAWNESIARSCKEDDNVNVLVLPADILKEAEAVAIIEAWLSAQFKEGRYRNRISHIDRLG